MATINDNYLKLPGSYLFAEIARRVAAYKEANPDADIIRLGIGDVTQPLPQVCIEAMHKAVDDQAKAETFHGYGPEQGYSFLTEAIIKNNYTDRGIEIAPDEIFVSDGSKSDCGNIQEIFGTANKVAITDPVYPVYLDTNVMAGRTGTLQEDGHFEGVVYLPCTAENNFAPSLPTEKVDMIYLCCPNNPTGTTLSREELTKWVNYAKENESVILFDAAYAAYITEDDVPRSIYEIPGAKDVAIEFRSFSKTAGFTGTRSRWLARAVQQALEPPSHDEVQRHGLHRPARRCGHLHGRGPEAGQRTCFLLYGERPHHPRGPQGNRHQGLRRRQCPVHLAQDAGQHELVGLLRQAPARSQHRRHAGRRLRSVR